MKILKYITLTLFLTAFSAAGVQAKPVKAQLYLFGFSASFKDSVVYVTEIQELKDAWIDNKTEFLLGRDNYSYQLKEYLTEHIQQPDRVCMVFYATSKAKAEKQLAKLKRKYTPSEKKKKKKSWKPYDIRMLSSSDFQFSTVDMSPEQQ